MVSGTITRLVNTFGSKWGEVSPTLQPRHLFFNVNSLTEGLDFGVLAVGDSVEFEQEQDRANGMRAIHMSRTAAAPAVPVAVAPAVSAAAAPVAEAVAAAEGE